MKSSVLVVAATALLLTGCACNLPEARKMDPHNPGVFVVDGRYIVVDQEPIYFAREMQNVRITWQLPADSKYRFSRDGISFKDAGDEIADCHLEQNGLRFSCLNKHSKPGKYKYTIKVDGSPVVPALDPTVVND
jgi:hypothetical protein